MRLDSKKERLEKKLARCCYSHVWKNSSNWALGLLDVTFLFPSNSARGHIWAFLSHNIWAILLPFSHSCTSTRRFLGPVSYQALGFGPTLKNGINKKYTLHVASLSLVPNGSNGRIFPLFGFLCSSSLVFNWE